LGVACVSETKVQQMPRDQGRHMLHRRALLYYESAVVPIRSCIEILICFFQDHSRAEGVRPSRALPTVISDSSNGIARKLPCAREDWRINAYSQISSGLGSSRRGKFRL
jgi:hypothetical protein